MKKRERIQVIYDILKVVQDKGNAARPTHILYKSNLSHQMMQEYLKELIAKDMLEERVGNRGKTYSLKVKGSEFLEKYRVVTDFMDLFDL
ncbi:MAG: winged helix-turn-helix domain-containing protein [Candidatus Woesearchaeota archaeon]